MQIKFLGLFLWGWVVIFAHAGEGEFLRDGAEKSFLQDSSRVFTPFQPATPMSYTRKGLSIDLHRERVSNRLEILRFTFPVPESPDVPLVIHWYNPHPFQVVQPGPLVLVLTVTGDPNYRIAKSMCSFFAKKNYRCVYVERNAPPKVTDLDSLVTLPSFPPKSTISARRTLDALEQLRFKFPQDKVGVVGISLGAIDALLLAASDTRVAAVATLLGGANIPEILTHIHGLGVNDYKRSRLKKMERDSLSLDGFKVEMAKLSQPAEPLSYYGPNAIYPVDNPLSPERFLMINILEDPAIPKESSDALYLALSQAEQHPEYQWFRLHFVPDSWKHVYSMLALGQAKKDIQRHFQKFLRDSSSDVVPAEP
ncbi:MAG: hypothetical protein HY399_02690 [Elusimicrobia bacterium]|nr:hypothetical protein [Elusimicrobiota bacterium]